MKRAATARRAYNSPLREELAGHTRQRLIDAAVELLGSRGLLELSVRAVAEHAGVSVPTAYRYFPTPNALIDALTQALGEAFGVQKYPETEDELLALLPVLWLQFEKRAPLMRAYLQLPAAGPLRVAGRTRRKAAHLGVVGHALPRLAAEERAALGAVLQLFTNSATWELWHDLWGLSGKRSGKLAAWATQALIAAVRKDPRGFAEALATDEGEAK
jgi:AcrR family transcriptional regulator